MNITYLDHLPKVPKEVLDDTDTILASRHSNGPIRDFYFVKGLNTNLDQWILANVIPLLPDYKFGYIRQYQVIKNGMPIHKDINRTIAYNYLIETGGDNINTNVFDEGRQLIESECITTHRWHSIQVDKFHNVTNLQENSVRIAITLSPVGSKLRTLT